MSPSDEVSVATSDFVIVATAVLYVACAMICRVRAVARNESKKSVIPDQNAQNPNMRSTELRDFGVCFAAWVVGACILAATYRDSLGAASGNNKTAVRFASH